MKTISFVKMNGAGNDFVFLTDRELSRAPGTALIKKLLDRHFGIGGDQLLYLRKTNPPAAYELLFFNADGSEAEMCGNGVRAVAGYLQAKKGIKKELTLKTKSGLRHIFYKPAGIEVDMGLPILEGRKIPVKASGPIVSYPVKALGKIFLVHAVSMGNPHAVIFVRDVDQVPLYEIGPVLENHPFFPKRVNVEFVQVLSKGRVRARVWERGAGETLACGTGACAIAVAASRAGKTARSIDIDLPGGRLHARVGDNGHVYLSGPVELNYEGRFYV